MQRKTTRPGRAMQAETGGRLQQLVEAGDTRELARRSSTLQSVMLDLHRQMAGAESAADLARTMGLALTGSFACERLVVLRRAGQPRQFESVAEIGDVPAALHEEAPALAARLAPFLPHVPPLAALLPPFSEAVAEAGGRLSELGFERAAWLNVDKQVEWLVLVGPKLSGAVYDEFDAALLRATFDAATLACTKLLLVERLEERHRELAVANRRLQQIDDLKSAILAGVGHELRTPLTRILSYAEAMRDEGVSREEARRFLGVIVANTQQLADRLGEALRFADLIGDRSAPQRVPLRLGEVIETVAKAQAGKAAARSLRLETHCEPLVVCSDPGHLGMILQCLIDNALKFTPEGGEVRVEALPEGAGAAIRVVDTGPGIPDEARDDIWRLFESGEARPGSGPQGLGLGLALARRLAAELGVRLELERSSAAGSIFCLHLPDAAANPEPERTPVASLRR